MSCMVLVSDSPCSAEPFNPCAQISHSEVVNMHGESDNCALTMTFCLVNKNFLHELGQQLEFGLALLQLLGVSLGQDFLTLQFRVCCPLLHLQADSCPTNPQHPGQPSRCFPITTFKLLLRLLVLEGFAHGETIVLQTFLGLKLALVCPILSLALTLTLSALYRHGHECSKQT